MNAEGRRAIVLITDGYDERSTAQYEDALTAVRAAGATVYVVGIGGVAGISIKGERLLRHLAVESGGRFFFPSTRRAARRSARHADRRRPEPLPDHVHAEEPEDRRDVAGHQRAHGGRDEHHPRASRLLRAEAGADQAAPRVHGYRSGRQLPRSRRRTISRSRKTATSQSLETFQEAVQDVSIVLALDSSGSMKKKEADVIASAQDFVSALQEKDQLALLTFGDKVGVRARSVAQPRLQPHGNRRVQGDRRHGALRRDDRRAASRQERRRPARGRRDDRRPRRGQRREGTGEHAHASGSPEARERQRRHGLRDRPGLEPGQGRPAADGGSFRWPGVLPDRRRRICRPNTGASSTTFDGGTSSATRRSHIQRDGSWRKVEIHIKSAPTATIRTSGGYFAPAK